LFTSPTILLHELELREQREGGEREGGEREEAQLQMDGPRYQARVQERG